MSHIACTCLFAGEAGGLSNFDVIRQPVGFQPLMLTGGVPEVSTWPELGTELGTELETEFNTVLTTSLRERHEVDCNSTRYSSNDERTGFGNDARRQTRGRNLTTAFARKGNSARRRRNSTTQRGGTHWRDANATSERDATGRYSHRDSRDWNSTQRTSTQLTQLS